MGGSAGFLATGHVVGSRPPPFLGYEKERPALGPVSSNARHPSGNKSRSRERNAHGLSSSFKGKAVNGGNEGLSAMLWTSGSTF